MDNDRDTGKGTGASAGGVTRKKFLTTVGATLTVPAISRAIDPFRRKTAKFTGLSLTTYSMKRHMKWWLGHPVRGGTLDMLEFLDYCAELGLEAAEITSYFFPQKLEAKDIHAVKRRAHLHGLDISGGAMGNNFAFPPNSEEAKEHMEYAKLWIDRFADMGAPVVRVFAGRKLPKGASDDAIIANVTANLETALAHAERRGVMLGIENHDFVRNIDYLLRILEAIDSKWLGVIWDSANLAPTPDPYRELERIAPYAITAQIKVMTKMNGKDTSADYARLIGILRDVKYRGYVVFEYEEPEDPYKAIPAHLEKLRALL